MLALQDGHAQCIPYLLWALWLDASGRPVSRDLLGIGAVMARGWQDVAVAPLRDLRRKLKPPVARVRAADQRRLRERVKTLELDAERMLLRMLEGASPPPDGDPHGPAGALKTAIQVWGGSPETELVEGLIKLVV